MSKQTLKSMNSGIDVDNYLAIPPEEAVRLLKKKNRSQLILFKKDLKIMYNDTNKLLEIGNKQLRAIGDIPENAKEINANIMVLATLAQKLEDLNTIVDEILKD